ncbi:RNA polymerase sigma factor [Novosphingobium barchaimii LL02]|uniref:RNA polymerase sigma factor n=1 Tax=Novosphingobium barchaimii LL02 TaxID=1114963 RepID=A0A0J7Y681_9SPHN|nr:sigma-70 family RNA polymerase sigma factor [Novosphingobium barchaimii]KMS58883.1 RNA polymerase sigma factor [Novosphingobium barchaimii LL02]
MGNVAEKNAVDARTTLAAALGQAGAGDVSALRRVYDLTSAKLFGICFRISGDREAAEDILQDVYVKIWRRAATFDASRASPVSWLATIAHNAAIDWRRAQPRYDAAPQGAFDAVADDAPRADDVMVEDEQRLRLLACLNGLEQQHAEAIRSTFLGGLTYQQLADHLQTPLGTIKSWIRRGMLKLKVCLGDA